MAEYVIQGETLTAIADAIRAKTAVENDIPTTAMAEEIMSIATGIVPSGTKEITENGEHDVTTYSSALVNVQGLPIGISKLSVCSFVPSSANETIKITHGLGEKPNFDIIFRNTKVTASGRSIVCMLSINIPVTTAGTAPSRGIKWITSDAPDNNYLWDCAASKTSYQGNATTISRTTSAGANSSSWEVGQTYYCVAGVLDAL